VGVFHEPPLSPFAFNCCFIASVNYGLATRQSNGNIVSKYLPIKKGRENEKVPCSSFVAGLVVGFAAASAAVAAPSASSSLEKVVILHYAKASARPAPFSNDSMTFKLIAKGVKWPSSVTYSINPVGSDLSTDTVLSTMATSASTWDNATSFGLFNPPTETTVTSIGITTDGNNNIIWKDIEDTYPGVIAATFLYYNRFSGVISEFDMVFNSYYKWNTTGDSSAMDVQDIATHELGHVCGLADIYAPPNWSLTMYGYSDLGETYKRDLATGDIFGVQKLYGQ